VRIFERVDRAHMLADVGGAYDISPHVLEAMDDLGVGPKLREAARPITELRTFSHVGKLIGSLVIPDSIDTVGMRRSVLQRTLLAALGTDTVTPATAVLGFEQDPEGVTVQLEGGSTARADALIGADGVHSKVRGGVLGEQSPHFCDCLCTWGRVEDGAFPELRDLPADACTWFGEAACFVLGHMDGLVIWSAFWHAASPERNADQAATKAFVLKRFSGYPAFVQALIRATPESTLAETAIWDREPSPHWTKGRVALIGDAAHPTTPFLGQGANSAITDGYVLSSLLGDLSLAEAFAAYEARRMHTVEKNVKAARRISDMMTGDKWWSSLATHVLFGWLPDKWLVKGILSADEANDMRDLIQAHRESEAEAVASIRARPKRS
jgi:salicylate hydroxylase